MNEVSYVNPIPRALAHYESELEQTVARIGITIARRAFPRIEDISGPARRIATLAQLFAAPRSLNDGTTLVIWPALGLLEPSLWRSSQTKAAVFVHDPEPLRHQIGFGRLARWIARGPLGSRATLVSHSSDATRELERRFPRNRILEVAHPILSRQTSRAKQPGRVVVAGQYKPVRDLDLLAELGPLLRSSGYSPLIVGSGWPPVPGWEVDSRYVPEAELDNYLGSADVVLLPYRRYFQSGISLRALEQGTLTVGSRTAFAERMFGATSPLIVEQKADAATWMKAIEQVSTVDSSVVFSEYVTYCDTTWRAFLLDLE